MNEYGDENQDYNIMLPSGGRRRSSMFDPDGEMMQKRKSRLDSMVSFSSDTDFDKMMTAMPKRRESRLAYENTYQLEPTEKPNLRQIQNAIYEVINTTCQDLEYEYISPCDVIKNVNQAVHKRLKALVPRRFKFTCQSFMLEHADNDLRIRSKWLWNNATDSPLTVQYEQNSSLKVITTCHFLYHE